MASQELYPVQETLPGLGYQELTGQLALMLAELSDEADN